MSKTTEKTKSNDIKKAKANSVLFIKSPKKTFFTTLKLTDGANIFKQSYILIIKYFLYGFKCAVLFSTF